MATVNCLVTDILQNILFCVQQEKKKLIVLEQVSKWEQNIYFWVNYSFKYKKINQTQSLAYSHIQ